METSTDPEQRRREEEEEEEKETYYQYSPCYFCQKVVEAFLKCLSYDSTPVLDLPTYPPPSEAEREWKFDEEIAVQSTRSLRLARRPRRPPVSSGGGGQIN